MDGSKYNIPLEEVHFFNAISIDEVGEVFEWKGKILRGITEDARPLADRYFSSGFLDYIVKKGMFPKTEISAYTNPKYCYILEHEKVELQTIDAEWSFDMLKDAALLVCEIAAVAWRYGFNMKDCHTKNVLFKDNKPIYVDLGSFVNIEEGLSGFKSYDQILSYYYYVLRLWSDGCLSLPKQLQCLYRFEKRDYLLYKYPLLRHLSRFLDYYLKIDTTLFLLTTSKQSSDFVTKTKTRAILWKIINKVKLFKWQKPQNFRKIIMRVRRPRYFDNKPLLENSYILTERQTLSLEGENSFVIVNPAEYNFLNVFTERIKNKPMITIDYNESRGNTNYISNKEKNLRLTCLTFNMSYPTVHFNYQTPPQNRIKASALLLVGAREISNELRKPIEVIYKTLLDYDFNTLVAVETEASSTTSSEEGIISQWYVLEDTMNNGGFVTKTYKKR